MSILDWFKPGVKLKSIEDLTLNPENLPATQIIDEFVSFPCVCGESVRIRTRLMPGDAVITECDNCGLSWTIYNPSLVITQTKDIAEPMQNKVWGEMSQ